MKREEIKRKKKMKSSRESVEYYLFERLTIYIHKFIRALKHVFRYFLYLYKCKQNTLNVNVYG